MEYVFFAGRGLGFLVIIVSGQDRIRTREDFPYGDGNRDYGIQSLPRPLPSLPTIGIGRKPSSDQTLCFTI